LQFFWDPLTLTQGYPLGPCLKTRDGGPSKKLQNIKCLPRFLESLLWKFYPEPWGVCLGWVGTKPDPDLSIVLGPGRVFKIWVTLCFFQISKKIMNLHSIIHFYKWCNLKNALIYVLILKKGWAYFRQGWHLFPHNIALTAKKTPWKVFFRSFPIFSGEMLCKMVPINCWQVTFSWSKKDQVSGIENLRLFFIEASDLVKSIFQCHILKCF